MKRCKRGVSASCLAAVILLLCATTACADDVADDIDGRVDVFGQVAFGSQPDKRDVIFKWSPPIRMTLYGEQLPERFVDDVQYVVTTYFERVSPVIDREFEWSREQVNFFLVGYQSREEAVPLLLQFAEELPILAEAVDRNIGAFNELYYKSDEPPCLYFYVHNNGHLFLAVIWVPTYAVYQYMLRCLNSRMTKLLGLDGEADTKYASIFKAEGPSGDLTQRDLDLLRVLYAPEILPNMPRSTALPIVRELFRQPRYGTSN